VKPIDAYFLDQKEPYQSIMLYLRHLILETLPEVEERFSYRIPFYNCYNKPMIYLNILKGKDFVDVAFVQGILLENKFPMLKDHNKRKQVRSVQIRNLEDIDIEEFVKLLHEASHVLSTSKKAWFV